MDKLTYMHGFGNEFESEAEGYEGALPRDKTNPQHLYHQDSYIFTEQLSGTAFTAPRDSNRRSWFYRLKPSVCHKPFQPMVCNNFNFGSQVDPNQKRWTPFEDEHLSQARTNDFVDGLRPLAHSDPEGRATSSVGIYIYLANQNMGNRCFYSADGDFLIVPQLGALLIKTEFGRFTVEPNEIIVIQQGMKFSVDWRPSETKAEDFMRGYVLEVRGNHFRLPELGPIGANGLANKRDFQVSRAHVDVDNLNKEHEIVLKFQNKLFTSSQTSSPYNVVAWFGDYTPYKYNLNQFVAMNSVTVDHPDPSIFTVLTCPSIGKKGTALADFVIFPPRWECASDTFRPPYFHRNCMTEFMGLIRGQYQAKSAKFAPGGGSLHQAMMPHGPDAECFQTAVKQDTKVPKRVADNTMAFMFETSLTLQLTDWALERNVDEDYHKCWQDLDKIRITD